VSGPGKRDNYLQIKEPAYRYHYYGEQIGNTTSVNSQFNIELSFGTSATLDMHKTWMVAIENFNATLLNNTATEPLSALSVVLSGIGQTTERSNVQKFDGTSVVFDFIGQYQHPAVITNSYIGHRITNPHFLNSSMQCSIYKTNAITPVLIADTTNKLKLNSLQFTLIIYEYDP
jgi:hypothetical protein